jgi:hypothetical protein
MLNNREAKARTAQLARARAIHPIKSFKESLQVLRRNAFAGVLNNNLVAARDDCRRTTGDRRRTNGKILGADFGPTALRR